MEIRNIWFEALRKKDVQELLEMKMPVTISYLLRQSLMTLNNNAQAYFGEKKKIIDKYRNGTKIDPEKSEDMLRELAELQAIRIEVDITKKELDINTLPDISVTQLEFMELFFDFVDKKEKVE